MRCDDLYVAGTGSYLPPEVPTRAAVEAGRWPADRLVTDRVAAIRVAGDEAAIEMAAAAAIGAVAHSGRDPADFALVLHASVYHQGLDLWAPASYVQREAVGGSCPAFEVRQMSNGGMAALELAASYLAADPRRQAALLSAGDKFCPPAFDRWTAENGMVFGDGAAAIVLARGGGLARLLSVATVGDGELERMHRGDEPFTDTPLAGGVPFAADARVRQYLRRVGLAQVIGRILDGQRAAVDRALADAGVGLADIDLFVLPHFGFGRLTAGFLRPFGIDPDATNWAWSRHIGHLGAADQFAGLDHLLRAGAPATDRLLLVLGIGSGFTWSAAVLRT
ncbi:ketoacyl-ACP synthase III family protein [Actinokineospora enzanensis]|uniref:ketoacyl-ACP synthase III family protein n=1 Tax=Actinokineospora enzanensis TaxID=155975 RepID=UPI0004766E93|nr:ketoacyl-ACP synthase III family protein [Actinokineospora enzanensis]